MAFATTICFPWETFWIEAFTFYKLCFKIALFQYLTIPQQNWLLESNLSQPLKKKIN